MAPADVEEVVADAEEGDGLEGDDGAEVGGELCIRRSVTHTLYLG